MSITDTDLKDLNYAVRLLENPGLAAKITNILGQPIEKGFKLLPENFSSVVTSATEKSLNVALEAALLTMDKKPEQTSWNKLHKVAAAASGGVGGFFGLPALAIELPISTTIMLRSIADIARSEQEIINDPFVKMACIEVFALGGPSSKDDSSETGYFAVRTALAKSVIEAAEYIAEKGAAEKGAPIIVKFIAKIATRFGVQVSEKVAAQAVPVIGAAGGAFINTVFMDHFQDMARGHFIVRRLEKKYDPAEVRGEYEKFSGNR